MKNVKNNGKLIPINSFHRKSTAGVCESYEETIPSLHHPPTEILKNLKPHSLYYIRNYSLNEKSFKTVYDTSMNVLYVEPYVLMDLLKSELQLFMKRFKFRGVLLPS